MSGSEHLMNALYNALPFTYVTYGRRETSFHFGHVKSYFTTKLFLNQLKYQQGLSTVYPDTEPEPFLLLRFSPDSKTCPTCFQHGESSAFRGADGYGAGWKRRSGLSRFKQVSILLSCYIFVDMSMQCFLKLIVAGKPTNEEGRRSYHP